MIARYVFTTGNVLGPWHHLDYVDEICEGIVDTDLRAMAFLVDPQLGRIKTPHGQVTFLQLVGLTHDELNELRQWNTRKFLKVLAKDNPLLITDLRRKSILRDPAKRRTVGIFCTMA